MKVLKKPTSVSLSEETLREIDSHPLSKDASRSAFVRVCVSEFLEREKTEKENKNDKSSEK